MHHILIVHYVLLLVCGISYFFSFFRGCFVFKKKAKTTKKNKENTVTSGHGGAVHSEDRNSQFGGMITHFESSIFNQNTASDGFGGAINFYIGMTFCYKLFMSYFISVFFFFFFNFFFVEIFFFQKKR